jgi:uncharacterized membrane protein YgaE (UPF0421/DUF939 family)
MRELILYLLGLFIGFSLSIYLLLTNDKINKYKEDKKLMNDIENFLKEISNKSEEEQKEDILNFVFDKVKIN